jgi:hypothetical protein
MSPVTKLIHITEVDRMKDLFNELWYVCAIVRFVMVQKS